MTESRSAHDEWEELAAGHALHALSPQDERRFLDHVGGCSACATTLDEYRLIGAQLGALADTEPDEPPSWQRIRGGIVDDRPASVVSLDHRRRPRSARILAAAAAVVTATAVGVAGWDASHPSGSRSTPATSAITACQQQEGCRAIRLHAQSGTNPAAVIVTGNEVSVVPLALPAAPSGRTYVLWQMPRDGGPVPVSEFRATDRQTATTSLPSSYADTTAFAISDEPDNVSPVRPTHVLAVGLAS